MQDSCHADLDGGGGEHANVEDGVEEETHKVQGHKVEAEPDNAIFKVYILRFWIMGVVLTDL